MSTKQDGDALAQFNELVTVTMRERRTTRDRAAGIVAKKYPKLHARVVREANADRPLAIQHSRFWDDEPPSAA